MTISDQIRKQLEQPDGLTIEALLPLAEEYDRETTKVNVRLAECTQLLRKGLRSEAIQRAYMKPNVLDWSASLDFPEFDDWLSILQFYGITVPTLLDRDAAQQLQEAIVDEQPLEELLRQHRRLAIAKAPLAWRLKVLRRLVEIDSINVVWREDQEQWETIRLKQIPAELKDAIDSKSTIAVQAICDELNDSRWTVKPSEDLCKRASKAAHTFLHAEQSQQLRAIAVQLHAAYSEGDESAATKHYKAWSEILKAMQSPPPQDLTQSVEPAIEWLLNCIADRTKIAKRESALASLEAALQKRSALSDLQRLYYDVTSLQLGVDPILEQRYRSRIAEIQLASRRRMQLSVASISSVAVMLVIAIGYWQLHRTFRKAVEDSSTRLVALIEADELKEAASIFEKLSQSAPQVAKSPELVALLGKLEAKQKAEDARAANVANAIEAVKTDDPTKIDLLSLVRAEKLAVTPGEKAEIQAVRRIWDRHEQEIIESQFDIVRAKLKEVEEKIESIKSMPIASVSESELTNMLGELNKLPADYPKGANRAAKIMELTSLQVGSLLDSVREQRREMAIRQQAAKGMREAGTLEQFLDEMKRFVEKLPGDPTATEYREAMQEAELWKQAAAWNAWCKALNDSLEGGLSINELKQLSALRGGFENMFLGIPYLARGLKMIDDQFVIAEQRESSLASLMEDLTNAAIADLVTLVEIDAGSRRFMTWEARSENDAALKKLTSKTTLPVVSDSLGATENVVFAGKLGVTNEPRTTIRRITRQLEVDGQAIKDDWEGGLTKVMQDVVRTQNLDSQIKEILLTRLIKASREGSVAMRDAFKSLDQKLNDRTELRAFWFNSTPVKDAIDNDVVLSIRDGMKQLELQKRESSDAMKNVAASKLEWVGAMLRGSDGKVQPWLCREELPECNLYCFVSDVQSANSPRVIHVGQVNGKQATLKDSAELTLSGRPLFRIQTTIPNQN
ncbi:MAG: hypothetical protein ACK56W_18270 [Pirellula sp.]|jgi:hypothetical protein|nr:hypothetical protein [Pirellula sp.]